MNKYYKILKNDNVQYIYINNFILFEDFKINVNNSKHLIDKYYNKWDHYKKINNKYEYVYNGNKTLFNKSIKPISRSYFKFHELSIDLNINLNDLHIFCIAEAPGGFIKNILDRSKNTNIYANSLLSKNSSVPSWNNLILNDSRVNILNGKDNTGSILNLDNINHMINEFNNTKCEIITADGGIDFSENYNNQELDSYKLIVCELFLAINIQKDDGTFIIKMFDIFYYNSVQIVYILNLFYDSVEIVKPCTSRSSNSEKYIICKNFNKININKYSLLVNKIKKYIESNHPIDIYVPISFILNMYYYNLSFVDNQVANIVDTIHIIENKKNINIEKKMYDNLEHAKSWFNKYNIL